MLSPVRMLFCCERSEKQEPEKRALQMETSSERRVIMMAKSKNMLEFIPKQNEKIGWQTKENGLVQLLVPHRGFYHKLAQILVKAPPISKIDMDQFGSFVWHTIDGRRSIAEIAEMVKRKFGKEAEPLYERLTAFFRILYGNRLILFQTPASEKTVRKAIVKKGA